MKTAISVPDDVFVQVEQIVRRAGRSRSEVYSDALREYVARHAPDDVTEALDLVVRDVGEGRSETEFLAAAGRGVLERTEW